jgi:hypothetical protein
LGSAVVPDALLRHDEAALHLACAQTIERFVRAAEQVGNGRAADRECACA